MKTSRDSILIPLNLGAGGENMIHIDVSENLPDCWCVEVGWVALELQVIQVDFDIQLRSRNCIKMDGNKKFPVAIFGTSEFDVQSIDIGTLNINGLPARLKRNGEYECSKNGDVNDDGVPDLVCRFKDDLALYEPVNFCDNLVPTFRLEAQTVDGLVILGRSVSPNNPFRLPGRSQGGLVVTTPSVPPEPWIAPALAIRDTSRIHSCWNPNFLAWISTNA
jgi:hypothetical protein